MKGNLCVKGTEIFSDLEKVQGSCPEIVGCKSVYPGVDEEYPQLHNKLFEVLRYKRYITLP